MYLLCGSLSVVHVYALTRDQQTYNSSCGWGHRLSRNLETYAALLLGGFQVTPVFKFGVCGDAKRDFSSVLMHSSEALFMLSHGNVIEPVVIRDESRGTANGGRIGKQMAPFNLSIVCLLAGAVVLVVTTTMAERKSLIIMACVTLSILFTVAAITTFNDAHGGDSLLANTDASHGLHPSKVRFHWAHSQLTPCSEVILSSGVSENDLMLEVKSNWAGTAPKAKFSGRDRNSANLYWEPYQTFAKRLFSQVTVTVGDRGRHQRIR